MWSQSQGWGDADSISCWGPPWYKGKRCCSHGHLETREAIMLIGRKCPETREYILFCCPTVNCKTYQWCLYSDKMLSDCFFLTGISETAYKSQEDNDRREWWHCAWAGVSVSPIARILWERWCFGQMRKHILKSREIYILSHMFSRENSLNYLTLSNSSCRNIPLNMQGVGCVWPGWSDSWCVLWVGTV